MGDLTLLPAIPDAWRTEGRSTEDDYFTAITDAIANHPRSLQTRIGPSEIGIPCSRKIGYKLAGKPERPMPPNWKATVGTATHLWLEETFDRANLTWLASRGDVGIERYLIEQTVTVGHDAHGNPITGHCDLYDRLTCTVIDHKPIGPTQLAKYRRFGPGEQYRQQAHLYGQGWVNLGMPVKAVAIAFLPRNGELRDAYWWTEPFDPAVAARALQRLHGIQLTIDLLGDQAFATLPTTEAYCPSCPFLLARSNDPAKGCPGHPGTAAATHEQTLSLSA